MRLLNVFRLVITYFVTFNKHLKSQLRDSLSGFIIVLVHSVSLLSWSIRPQIV